MIKMVFAAAIAAAAFAAAPASAQDAPATTEATESAKFSVDTPIEELVADERAKAVLDELVPGLTTHASYEMFKSMSLRQLQPYSQGQINDKTLDEIDAALGAIA
jgi:hypothetical protein